MLLGASVVAVGLYAAGGWAWVRLVTPSGHYAFLFGSGGLTTAHVGDDLWTWDSEFGW